MPPRTPRDFRPRESHQSAPGALPGSAGSPRTPGLPSRPSKMAPTAGATARQLRQAVLLFSFRRTKDGGRAVLSPSLAQALDSPLVRGGLWRRMSRVLIGRGNVEGWRYAGCCRACRGTPERSEGLMPSGAGCLLRQRLVSCL